MFTKVEFALRTFMSGVEKKMNTKSLSEKDKDYFFHPFTALRAHEQTGGKIIVAGKDSTIEDSDGNKFIDSMAGLWCVNIGYGNKEMAESIHDQVLKLSYYHAFSSFSTDLAVELSARLIKMAPVPMSKVFFGNSGSDANDTNAKIVWFYNNALGRKDKKKIIARRRGYHGVTVLSSGLTGLDNLHDGFDLPLPMIRHVRPPHRLWEKEPGTTDAEFSQILADELEALILKEGPDTVAAFIAEPFMAAGGVLIPPAEYFPAIQKVLKKYDVLLIADEVVSAFGRLGQMFGTTAFGMAPDIITVAKGITSAYIPLSASIISEKIWRVLAEGSEKYGAFGHGYTYSAHPLAARAAMTNLDFLEKNNLVGQAATRGAYLQKSLREEFGDHPMVGEVRGQGLVAAIEFVASKTPMTAFAPSEKIAARIARRSMELGVITRALPAGDSISFSPPFIITEEEIDTIVKTARRAVDDVMKEIGR